MNFPTPHKPIKSTILALAVGLNLAVAMLTVFSAYGGTFNPEDRVIASMAAMVLPLLLLAGIALCVVNLLVDKRLILVIAAGWIISLPSILVFSPLHFWKPALTEQQKKDSFTFLTYNVLHFWDFRGEDYPGVEQNETLDYIISTNADIVNLQEYDVLDTKGPWKIKEAQIDSLNALYPYQYTDLDLKYALLSKYPFEKIELEVHPKAKLAMLGFRLNIQGHEIHLINVHLKSIGLTPEDKTLYKEALEMPATKSELKRELKEVKSQLLTKLSEAFKIRTLQARTVRNIVDSIGGPFIVAGDFNDIPDCYALRILAQEDFKSAFSIAGCGPTYTYHGNRFFFNIDHVLYRGKMHAVSYNRQKEGNSDHYPLEVKFIWKD